MNKIKNNRKIYVVGGDKTYANWMEGEIVDKMEDASLVLGTGGEDWHPKWYGENENPHRSVYSNINRDNYEMKEFQKAIKLNKPIIGICRSAQGGCVLAGGKLVQHQNNQGYTHYVKCSNGDKILVTSLHHQAQYPFNLKEGEDYKLLNWTENELGKRYLNGNKLAENSIEVETAYYPKIKFLSIQSHPEMYFSESNKECEKGISYFRNLLNCMFDKNK